MTGSTCPQCGTAFACCPRPDQRCWCLDLPPLPAQLLGRDAAGCYCPRCLRDRLSAAFSPGQEPGLGGAPATAARLHPDPRAAGAGEPSAKGAKA